jgi:hypothetical protein
VGDEKIDLFSLLRTFFQSNSIGFLGRSGGIFECLDCCSDFGRINSRLVYDCVVRFWLVVPSH